MYDADLAFADLMCDMKNYFLIGSIDPVARRLWFNDQWDIVHIVGIDSVLFIDGARGKGWAYLATAFQ